MQINPEHWDILSKEDKDLYTTIYSVIASPSNRNKRNKRLDDFSEILAALKIFLEKDEVDQWKRCLVCGVCFLSDGIAVNTAQLRKLTNKCKSTINGSLKGMGYEVNDKNNQELLEKIPYLSKNQADIRKWTVRTLIKPYSHISDDITPPMASSQFSAPMDSVSLYISEPIEIVNQSTNHNISPKDNPSITPTSDQFLYFQQPLNDDNFFFDSPDSNFNNFDSVDSELPNNLCDISDDFSFLSFE